MKCFDCGYKFDGYEKDYEFIVTEGEKPFEDCRVLIVQKVRHSSYIGTITKKVIGHKCPVCGTINVFVTEDAKYAEEV